ncbi:cytochrome C oxidase subunit IV family protein [Mycobacterium sp. 1274756.6]|uniref:cytochrome C oxidase subunit IV family protein n=1 Tax=Mycobacterium sp. 1274756.6 TaxID=1834076 RepID=UPI0009EE4B6C|nr:cytochrome C oxidase subunit IV family protein [Mycobacterium sp. 1274756.6]
MTLLLRDRIGLIWLFLVAATSVTWWLGRGHGPESLAPEFINVTIIAVGAVKLRLIGLHFMELRSAPTRFRWIFESIVAGLFVLLAGLVMLD